MKGISISEPKTILQKGVKFIRENASVQNTYNDTTKLGTEVTILREPIYSPELYKNTLYTQNGKILEGIFRYDHEQEKLIPNVMHEYYPNGNNVTINMSTGKFWGYDKLRDTSFLPSRNEDIMMISRGVNNSITSSNTKVILDGLRGKVTPAYNALLSGHMK